MNYEKLFHGTSIVAAAAFLLAVAYGGWLASVVTFVVGVMALVVVLELKRQSELNNKS